MSGLGGFVLCGVDERRDHPLKGGWSHSLPVGDSGVTLCSVVTYTAIVKKIDRNVGHEIGYLCRYATRHAILISLSPDSG